MLPPLPLWENEKMRHKRRQQQWIYFTTTAENKCTISDFHKQKQRKIDEPAPEQIFKTESLFLNQKPERHSDERAEIF